MIPVSRKRLLVLYVVLAALLLGLGARAWFLQVVNHRAYVAQANLDRIRDIVEPTVRGEITDDVGAPLVSNRSALVISVNMSLVGQESDGGAAELRKLAALLHISDKTLTEKVRICTATVSQPCWPGSPYQPIPVAEHVSDRVGVQVLEDKHDFPGVTAQVQPVTQYAQPMGTDAAQILGYLQPITAHEVQQLGIPVTGFSGVDLVGQAGLEQQYDKQLRGRAGANEVSVNAAGQVTGTIKRITPQPGDDLVTSLNSKLQQDVENDLAGAIHKTEAEGNSNARTGAAVVLTTKGQVVAMASYPTYNPDVWTNGITGREFHQLFGGGRSEPILNRATQGEYAPGSTWKVTSTAAAIAAGYSLYGSYDCPGSVNVEGHVFNNDFGNGGVMSLHQALVLSCDTIFYNFAYQIWQRDHRSADVVTSPHAPVQEMQKMELGWGFGKNPGVDLPEQSPGTVPTREWLYYYWKDNAHQGQNWCKYGRANGSYVQQIEYDDCRTGNVWEPGQAVDAAIGQGYVSVTPLQLADAYVALANGGTLYQPADRRGAAQPERPGHAADPAQGGRAPAGGQVHAGLHPQRAAGRDHVGHRGQRLRRVPAEQGLRGGQDRHRPGGRQGRHLGVRLVRAVLASQVRGGHDDPRLRLRRRRVGPGGPQDLGRDLRPGGAPGGPGRRAAAQRAEDEQGRADRLLGPAAKSHHPAGGRRHG